PRPSRTAGSRGRLSKKRRRASARTALPTHIDLVHGALQAGCVPATEQTRVNPVEDDAANDECGQVLHLRLPARRRAAILAGIPLRFVPKTPGNRSKFSAKPSDREPSDAYSGVMPACSTTLAHFAASRATSARISATE